MTRTMNGVAIIRMMWVTMIILMIIWIVFQNGDCVGDYDQSNSNYGCSDSTFHDLNKDCLLTKGIRMK